MNDALTPTAEMKRVVDLLAGRWDMALTFAPGPMAPEGGSGEGQRRAGQDRAASRCSSRQHPAGRLGRADAGGIIEWSPSERVYKLHWVNTLSHVGSYFDGAWVGDDLVFNETEYIMGHAFASRHSITNIRPDAFHYTIDIGSTHEQLDGPLPSITRSSQARQSRPDQSGPEIRGKRDEARVLRLSGGQRRDGCRRLLRRGGDLAAVSTSPPGSPQAGVDENGSGRPARYGVGG